MVRAGISEQADAGRTSAALAGTLEDLDRRWFPKSAT